MFAIQLRPEYANPKAILDVRVRRALAYSLDKKAMIDGLFEGGDVPLADQFLPSTVPYFSEMDRSIRKYPYDLKQADQLLGEMGDRKGPDGGYLSDEQLAWLELKLRMGMHASMVILAIEDAAESDR